MPQRAICAPAFFFVWTLLSLGVTATFFAILPAHALWRLPWRCANRQFGLPDLGRSVVRFWSPQRPFFRAL